MKAEFLEIKWWNMKIDKHLLNYSICSYMLLSGIGLIVVYSTTGPISFKNGLNSFRMVATQAGFSALQLGDDWDYLPNELDFLKRPGVIAFVIIAEIILLFTLTLYHRNDQWGYGWLKNRPSYFAQYVRSWRLF